MSSILIIDDRKENVDFLRVILEDRYKIYVALNGAVALKILEKVEPDLILLDIVMPVMDGFEVFRSIKENINWKDIPVIFVTGASDAFTEAKALTLGAVDFISKPFNPVITRIKIKNQIDRIVKNEVAANTEATLNIIDDTSETFMLLTAAFASYGFASFGEQLRIKQIAKIFVKGLNERYPDLLGKFDSAAFPDFCLLRDIGMSEIREVYLQESALSEEQSKKIINHSKSGLAFFTKLIELAYANPVRDGLALSIISGHHENFDGSGYPEGLSGYDIPLHARIARIVDCYSALTSKRGQREAFDHDTAVKIMTDGDGTTKPSHFDPVLLDVFVSVSDQLRYT